ncbi:MAG: outer membrane protein assembly factor BamD [Bacteroidales bacterium]|nr:outer membrane protein assembly factor BamD [Bacteroidales bacterium]
MFTKFASLFIDMKYWGLIVIVVMLFFSCESKHQKLLKSNDYDKQYEVALQLFNESDYQKSQQLFEGLVSVFRGSVKGENSLYYLARCHFYMEDYMLAGYYFGLFASTYPNSEKLEETQYYSALSYYYESPKPSQDQEYTVKAIEGFQVFINQFPQSSKVDTSNFYMSELRKKLEQKAFNKAQLYVNMSNYKAAVIELNNFLREFPDSDYREKALFLILSTGYELALNSVSAKQLERYESALNSYYDYIDEFPKGIDSKEAEKIFTNCKKYIDNYKSL